MIERKSVAPNEQSIAIMLKYAILLLCSSSQSIIFPPVTLTPLDAVPIQFYTFKRFGIIIVVYRLNPIFEHREGFINDSQHG